MFGISFSEIAVVAAIALIVVGPQKLPGMLRSLGEWLGKLRRLTSDMRAQTGIDDILREEGIDGVHELRSLLRGELAHQRRPGTRSRAVNHDAYAELADPEPGLEYPDEGPDISGAIPDDLVSPALETAHLAGTPSVGDQVDPSGLGSLPTEPRTTARHPESAPTEGSPAERGERPSRPKTNPETPVARARSSPPGSLPDPAPASPSGHLTPPGAQASSERSRSAAAPPSPGSAAPDPVSVRPPGLPRPTTNPETPLARARSVPPGAVPPALAVPGTQAGLPAAPLPSAESVSGLSVPPAPRTMPPPPPSRPAAPARTPPPPPVRSSPPRPAGTTPPPPPLRSPSRPPSPGNTTRPPKEREP